MQFSFIFNRAKNLILNPQAEWTIIQAETKSRSQLIKDYAVPFILLLAICTFVGSYIFSFPQYSFGAILTKTIVSAVLGLSGVYLSAIIINELAVSFGMPKNIEATFVLVVYSFTSYFITSSLVGLFPQIQIINLFGLHSIYLFWIGTSLILKTPEENKLGFVIVSMLIIIGIYAIFSLILQTILTGMTYHI